MGFDLVFSLSKYVILISNSEKPGSHNFQYIYLNNLPVCHQAYVAAAFPHPTWVSSCLGYHKSSSFSSPYPHTAPTMNSCPPQSQLMDFGLNCLRRKDRQRKGKGMGGEEMGKRGRRVNSGKEKVGKGKKLNITESLQLHDCLASWTLSREAI